MSDDETLMGPIFEESQILTVGDLSRLCAVEERRIVEFVEEGVLQIVDVHAAAWRFSGTALKRARAAIRLQRDLELNLPGVALVMELMDELEQLRRELARR